MIAFDKLIILKRIKDLQDKLSKCSDKAQTMGYLARIHELKLVVDLMEDGEGYKKIGIK